ncbi:hypothetical protein CDL15_Pgr024624 [Punica granatum]|uniref:Uncharacterized protein n=1 Tax=Punica granatum TaxID=22663 RepID=A0A218W6J5_PUNGR|nr:hypothetical protein CDL15_Pgr024624 [Punica granatum]
MQEGISQRHGCLLGEKKRDCKKHGRLPGERRRDCKKLGRLPGGGRRDCKKHRHLPGGGRRDCKKHGCLPRRRKKRLQEARELARRMNCLKERCIALRKSAENEMQVLGNCMRCTTRSDATLRISFADAWLCC